MTWTIGSDLHQKLFPEQYAHEFAGQEIKVYKEPIDTPIEHNQLTTFGTCERVYTDWEGKEYAVIKNLGMPSFYPLERCAVNTIKSRT